MQKENTYIYLGIFLRSKLIFKKRKKSNLLELGKKLFIDVFLQKFFSCFIDLVVSYTWTKAKDGNLPKDYFGYIPPNSYDSIQFCRVDDNTDVRYSMHFYFIINSNNEKKLIFETLILPSDKNKFNFFVRF